LSRKEILTLQDGRDVVLTWREPINPVLAAVVGLRTAAGTRQPARALDELVAHRHHLRVGHRIAELVDDAPGDDAGADQPQVDLVEHLAVGQRHPLAGTFDPLGAVRGADVVGLVAAIA
jgi:hypothetical protein